MTELKRLLSQDDSCLISVASVKRALKQDLKKGDKGMTEFVILSRPDMLVLCDDKPVTIYINKKPYVLCTDEYFEKQIRSSESKLKPCPFCGINEKESYECDS